LAEAAYSRMSAGARMAARAILLRLAETGEAGAVVRRRVPRRELDDDLASREALRVLTERRLVTTSDAGVEVTHEALLSHWPRLTAWLADDAIGREVRRHLAPTALEWEDAGRPESELYRGIRLAAAAEWAAGHEADLTAVEREFLEASGDYTEREVLAEIARADREAAGRRRWQQLLAAAAVLLLVAVTGTVIAIDRQRAATRASRIADARRLAAQALVDADLDRSLLLATEAVDIYDSWETRGGLLAVLARQPRAIAQVHGVDAARLQDLTLTSDGKAVVAGDNSGNVMVWDAQTMRPIVPVAQIGGYSGRIGPGASPSTILVRLHDRHVMYDFVADRVLTDYRPPPGNGKIGVGRPVLSGGGSTVIVRDDGELLFYDRASGRIQHRLPLPGLGDLFGLDGNRVLTLAEDLNSLIIVDSRTRTMRELKLSTGATPSAAVAASADARQIAVALEDGGVTVLDAATGNQRHRFPAGAAPDATSLAFSPNGRLIAVGLNEGVTSVFDLEGAKVAELSHRGPVKGVAFSHDGRTLYTVSMDNTMIAWDVSGDRALGLSRNAVHFAPTAAQIAVDPVTAQEVTAEFSADGRTASLGLSNGFRVLVDMATGRPLGPTATPQTDTWWVADDVTKGVRFIGTKHGLIKVDLASGALIRKAKIDSDRAVIDVRVSASGRRVTIVSAVIVGPDNVPISQLNWTDAQARMLDSETLEPIGEPLPLPAGIDAYTAWPAPDGSAALMTDTGNMVAYVDPRGHIRWAANLGSDFATRIVAFPPGRNMVIIGLESGALIELDTETGRTLARVTGADGFVRSIALSPDGQLVAAGGGTDGTIRVFTVDELRLVGQPLGSSRYWVYPSFSADGRTLMSIDEVGAVASWPISRDALVQRACSIVRRNLTGAEWKEFLPDRHYEETCPGADGAART